MVHSSSAKFVIHRAAILLTCVVTFVPSAAIAELPIGRVHFQNNSSQQVKIVVQSYTDASDTEHPVNREWTVDSKSGFYPGWQGVTSDGTLSPHSIKFAVRTDEGKTNWTLKLKNPGDLLVTVEQSDLPVSPETAARNKLKPWLILLIGGICLVGILWQLRLFKKDKAVGKAQRLRIPAYFCAAVIIGFVGFGLFSLFDSRNRTYSPEDLFRTTGKAIVFSICLLGKSYLGPLFVAGALSYSVYCFAQFGHLESVPILSGILDWVFDAAPDAVQSGYLVLVCLYAFGSSFHDAFEHATA